jgi:hypothetical protein
MENALRRKSTVYSLYKDDADTEGAEDLSAGLWNRGTAMRPWRQPQIICHQPPYLRMGVAATSSSHTVS